jgi:hypothetical protein
MKKHLLGSLLLLSFALGVSAQKAAVAKPDAAQERLRTDVTYLASDKLEGRRTGEAGAIAAADYVSKRFASLKLKPARQKFPYFSGVELGAGNALKINLPETAATAKLRTDFMPAGFSSNGEVGPTDVVFAGYGVVSEEAKIDDYKGLDVTGKIVLVFNGTQDGIGNPHSLLARFADARVKAKVAHDKGAKALLIISGEAKLSDDRLANLSFDQALGDTAIPTAVIARPVGVMLLGGSSEEDLKQDEEFIKLRKDAGDIGLNLTGRPKATASLTVALTKKQVEAANVVGILPGTDPALKNEAIVIGAHYDHLGHGGEGSLDVNSKEIHHGADDNASGTSAMLELAARFAKAKNNKRTIIFIAFSGEEEGLIGSKFYVNNPLFPLDKTVAMINMDMVGRLKDGKLTVGGIGTASEFKALAEAKNMGAKYTLELSEDGFGPSDHSSFYGKQVPVLFLFTNSHADYHKPSDTADKINYAGLSSIVDYAGELAKAIDQNAVKPTYSVAKSSGLMGRPSFAVTLGVMPNYSDGGSGMILDAVRDGSPADKAGLKAGDKVIMLAGKEVRNANDYTVVLGEMKAGQEYEVILIRGSEKMTLKVVPTARK